jgi:hypothetical protein
MKIEGEALMAMWTRDELDSIGAAEELEITPLGRGGAPRKPVTIWTVRVGDDLYVRSAYGRNSAWFRAAQARHQGRIRAGGVDKNVSFIDADPRLNDEIDAAYRAKYRRHGEQYVNMMISSEACAATIRLAPLANA